MRDVDALSDDDALSLAPLWYQAVPHAPYCTRYFRHTLLTAHAPYCTRYLLHMLLTVHATDNTRYVVYRQPSRLLSPFALNPKLIPDTQNYTQTKP